MARCTTTRPPTTRRPGWCRLSSWVNRWAIICRNAPSNDEAPVTISGASSRFVRLRRSVHGLVVGVVAGRAPGPEQLGPLLELLLAQRGGLLGCLAGRPRCQHAAHEEIGERDVGAHR